MCWQSTNLSHPREAKSYPEKGFAVSRIPKLSETAFVREQTTSHSVSLRSQDYDGTDSLHAVVMELWKQASEHRMLLTQVGVLCARLPAGQHVADMSDTFP